MFEWLCPPPLTLILIGREGGEMLGGGGRGVCVCVCVEYKGVFILIFSLHARKHVCFLSQIQFQSHTHILGYEVLAL